MKASQIVPEYTVELRGASVSWASKDKSSKKNVLEVYLCYRGYSLFYVSVTVVTVCVVLCCCADDTGVCLCLQLKTRQRCEYLMQYDTESIISDWLKVMQDTIRQLVPNTLTH